MKLTIDNKLINFVYLLFLLFKMEEDNNKLKYLINKDVPPNPLDIKETKIYKITCEKEYYLIIEYDINNIYLKIEDVNKLSFYWYSNKYDMIKLQKELKLSSDQYTSLEKIFKFFDLFISHEMIKLNYLKEKEQMILKIKRKVDFEEFESELILNKNRKNQEEEISIIFEHINKLNNQLDEKNKRIKNLEERINKIEKTVAKDYKKKLEEGNINPKNQELQEKNKHLDYNIFQSDCKNLHFKCKICDNILTDGNVYEYFCFFISLKNE